jgi:hypothetical protein
VPETKRFLLQAQAERIATPPAILQRRTQIIPHIKHPDGRELGEKMPWRPIGQMDDEELSAYEYLTHLPGF